MEDLCRTGTAPAFSNRDGNGREPILQQLNGKQKPFANCTLRIPHGTCRRLAERAQPGAARHRREV